jgi:hypothetical protein
MGGGRRAGVVIGGAALVALGGAVLFGFRSGAPGHRPARSPVSQETSHAPTVSGLTASASASSAAEARRRRDAMREQILEALRRRGAASSDPPAPAAAAPARSARAAGAPDGESVGRYDPDYIRTHFREDMFPLMRSCYESALVRAPKLRGRLVLSFRIVGDPEVGGVVDEADFTEESDLEDADMETCVRESLMTLTFDKPPSGGGFVTVRYPVMFSPGDDEEDAG